MRAGGAEEDSAGALYLGDIGAVVGRCQGGEDFLNDLAAIVLKRALEAGAHFMPVGKVVGDGHDFFVFQFLGGIFGERISALRRRRRQPDKPRARMPLRHVLRRGDTEGGYFLLSKIVGDRKRLEGGEGADDAVDIVLFDQLLSLGAGGGGNAGRIRDNQLDLAARERVLALLQEHRQGKLHVDAARGPRSALGPHQANADSIALLGKNDMASRHLGDTYARNAADKLPSRYRHWILPGTLYLTIACSCIFIG